MKHALFLNLMILALILAALWITGRGEVLIALVMLRDMPFGLLMQQPPEEDSDPKIGFTAEV
jgi:hypothetical protein